MNKKIWVTIAVVAVLVAGAFGVKKHNAAVKAEKERVSWLAPYYNSKKEYTLLSSDVHKLNKKQEESFYDIARGAIMTEYPSIEFTNLDDYSIFVKKAEGKHNYYIRYICESSTIKLRFKTVMTVSLDKESLKGDTPFKYWDMYSDLADYADEY